MSAAIGIDLGTTNTVAGFVRDGTATTLADEAGRRLVPSVVSFHPSGKVLVGHAAKERRIIDAANTIYSVKRFIGRAWTTPEVQEARKRFPFEMREGPKAGVAVAARGEAYTLPEISAFVLRHAKTVAEKALGEPVERAVITVPANFNDLQRAATKVSGKLAGLQVLRILNEPTAAALAYGQQEQAQSERIAVYDLGGGTFDITILDLSGSVYEVLATAGDTNLGGDDIDLAIAERMAEQCMRQFRFDPRSDNVAFSTLRLIAETVKRDLTNLPETTIDIADVIPEGPKGTPTLQFRMTRAELEQLTLPFIEKTFRTCQVALENAHLKVGAIHRTILVGGATRMPLLVKKVEEFFKKPPYLKINPDEVVALGAAIQAGALDRTKKVRPPAPGTTSDTQVLAGRQGPAPAPAPPALTGVPEFDFDTAKPGDSSLFDALPASGGPQSAPLSSPYGSPRSAPQPPPSNPGGGSVGGGSVPFLPDFDFGQPEVARATAAAVAANAAAPLGALGPPGTPPASTFFEFSRPSAGLVFEEKAPASQAPHGMRGAIPPGAAPLPPELGGPQQSPAKWDEPLPMAAPAPTAPSSPRAQAQKGVSAPLLIDVTPLSLSVETVGDFGDTLIARNTPVPCDKTRVFSTARDNQSSVSIRVAQGEQPKFSQNTYLGELELSGIPPGLRGEVQIAVTFELDADGILNVRAKEQKSGKETRVKIHLVGAQNDKSEIDAMMARQASKSLG